MKGEDEMDRRTCRRYLIILAVIPALLTPGCGLLDALELAATDGADTLAAAPYGPSLAGAPGRGGVTPVTGQRPARPGVTQVTGGPVAVGRGSRMAPWAPSGRGDTSPGGEYGPGTGREPATGPLSARPAGPAVDGPANPSTVPTPEAGAPSTSARILFVSGRPGGSAMPGGSFEADFRPEPIA